MKEFADKTAVITGGASGIGFALAQLGTPSKRRLERSLMRRETVPWTPGRRRGFVDTVCGRAHARRRQTIDPRG